MRIKASILVSCLLTLSIVLNAQKKKTGNDVQSVNTKGKWNVEIGAGASAYEGDLTEKSSFFGQPGYVASIGGNCNLSKQFALGLDFSYLKLRADDKKMISLF